METIKDLGKYTFPCLLANSVKKFADRPAVAQVWQKEFTYSEVNEKSQEFSKQLLSLGLSAGSKIAILGVGKPNWGIAYFGIVNQGMIAVPLLTDFSKTEISAIMNHCGVDAIIVEKRLFEKNKEIEADLPSIVIDLDTFQLIKGEEKIK